MVPSLVILTDH